MGLKQILPIAAGAAILAASGGTAAPALAAAAEGAGAAGAGAGGLLGAASGMTGTALGTGTSLLGTGAATAAESAGSMMTPTLQLSQEIAPNMGAIIPMNAAEIAPNMGSVIPMTAGHTTESMTPSMFANGANNGGISALNSATSAPSTWDTRFGSMKDLADKYGTVNNLNGAANLGMKYADMNKPRPMQSSGQVSRGQAPTMEALMALQKMGYQLPQNKKINFSLLG